MLKSEMTETTFNQNLDERNDEIEQLRETISKMKSNLQKKSLTNDEQLKNTFQPNKITKSRSVSNFYRNLSVANNSTYAASMLNFNDINNGTISDCQIQGCIDRKRKLIDENNCLLEKV